MRPKVAEKTLAIELRRRGFSYSEIQEKVPVSQSSLSLWLRAIELSAAQRERLANRKISGQLLAARTVREARVRRVEAIGLAAQEEARNLLSSRDSLWLIGTVLYWAEGAKLKPWRSKRRVCFTNMDPRMIRAFRAWLFRYCNILPSEIIFALCIHSTANVARARRFWSRELSVNQHEIRTYFKRPNVVTRRKNIGEVYYGTMRVEVLRSTSLLYRIEGWIKTIAAAGSANWKAISL